jgi:hypothetical protein
VHVAVGLDQPVRLYRQLISHVGRSFDRVESSAYVVRNIA